MLLLSQILRHKEVCLTQYIWHHPQWPDFTSETKRLLLPLGRCRNLQGQLIQQVSSLGLDLALETQLEALTQETVKTAELEGEFYNPEAVRSSIASRLGLPTAGVRAAPRTVDGLVDVLLDATNLDNPTLTADRLKAWQAALFPNGRSGLFDIAVGKWRSQEMQVVSGRHGRKKIHYIAPPPENVGREMKSFFEWWERSQPHFGNEDPILRAGIAHYWFVAIHPFDDGNGRIARALSDMALAQAEGAAKRCYSLSSMIMESRDGYYEVLEKTSNGQGDITDWLCWFLDCHEQAMKHSQQTISKVLGISHFWLNISDVSLNDRQRKVVKKLLEAGRGGFKGGFTAKKHQGIVKGSRATLARDLADLVEKRILLAAGEKKGTRYELNWSLASPSWNAQ